MQINSKKFLPDPYLLEKKNALKQYSWDSIKEGNTLLLTPVTSARARNAHAHSILTYRECVATSRTPRYPLRGWFIYATLRVEAFAERMMVGRLINIVKLR